MLFRLFVSKWLRKDVQKKKGFYCLWGWGVLVVLLSGNSWSGVVFFVFVFLFSMFSAGSCLGLKRVSCCYERVLSLNILELHWIVISLACNSPTYLYVTCEAGFWHWIYVCYCMCRSYVAGYVSFECVMHWVGKRLLKHFCMFVDGMW